MIQTLWHNFRPWRIWTSSVILLGLLLVAARCNSTLEPTPTPTAKAEPPEIIGFTLDPSGPLFPEARVGIQVDTNCHDRKINNYRWVVGAGEGIIISGNGTTLITYQAPETPGSYEVRVELEYEGGQPVEGSTTVEVISEPTLTPTYTPTPSPTPTDTPTPTPTDTPTPTPTDTPTPLPDTPTAALTATDTPIPTAMPILTLYPAPILSAPEDGAGVAGTFPPLYWNWNGKLGEDEYFEVRIWHESMPYRTSLGWVKDPPQFDYNITDERAGKYYWSVIVIKDEYVRTKDWYDPKKWPYPVWEHDPEVGDYRLHMKIMSQESEERFFFYTPGGGGGPISVPPTSCPDPDDC
jgi:hypothetical protein